MKIKFTGLFYLINMIIGIIIMFLLGSITSWTGKHVFQQSTNNLFSIVLSIIVPVIFIWFTSDMIKKWMGKRFSTSKSFFSKIVVFVNYIAITLMIVFVLLIVITTFLYLFRLKHLAIGLTINFIRPLLTADLFLCIAVCLFLILILNAISLAVNHDESSFRSSFLYQTCLLIIMFMLFSAAS